MFLLGYRVYSNYAVCDKLNKRVTQIKYEHE